MKKILFFASLLIGLASGAQTKVADTLYKKNFSAERWRDIWADSAISITKMPTGIATDSFVVWDYTTKRLKKVAPVYAKVQAGANSTLTGSGTVADPYVFGAPASYTFFTAGEGGSSPVNGDSIYSNSSLSQFKLYDVWRGPFHQFIGDTGSIQIDTASGRFTFHPPLVTGEQVTISAKNSQPLRSVPYKNFDPTTIANIYAWFDATDASTITASSSLVGTWASKIGSGRNMAASGTDRPTYVTTGGPNLQSYVHWGSGKYMLVDVTPDVTGIMTVYMVARINTWNNGDRIFYYGAVNGLDGIVENTTGTYKGLTVYDGIAQAEADYNNDITGWQLIKAEFSGNGAGKLSKGKNGGFTFYLNFPPSVDPTDIIINYLGMGQASGDYDVAECIVVAGQVDDVQRNLAENYLINKYALGNTNNILFFGDSHTSGLLSGTTLGPYYVELTGRELGMDVMNLGKSGTVVWPNGSYTGNTGQNLSDLYNDVDPYIRTAGQYICLQYGTNDGNNPATVGTWKTNYKNYIQHFIDLGVPANKIVICSPPYTTSPTYGTNTTATTAVVAAIASEMGIKYCNFNAGLQALGINAYTVAGGDGIHLDGPGHRSMADILKAKILE